MTDMMDLVAQAVTVPVQCPRHGRTDGVKVQLGEGAREVARCCRCLDEEVTRASIGAIRSGGALELPND
mgnify:CR=1 FL=1